MRRTAHAVTIALAAAAGATIGAAPAGAAVILSAPPKYVTSGVGPFVWTFASTMSGQYMGGTQFKLSNEPQWHRCRVGASENRLVVQSLPDGVYTFYVADDYSRHVVPPGHGWASACFSGFSDDWVYFPNSTPVSADMYVDSVPPAAGEVSVQAQGATFGGNRYVLARMSLELSDATSGIESIRWDMGDGTNVPSFQDYGKNVTSIDHSYYRSGNYAGTVTITDRAGHQTTRAFSVAVPELNPSPPGGAIPPPAPAADRVPPSLSVSAARRQRALKTGSLTVQTGCSEVCELAATASATVRGRKLRVTAGTRTSPASALTTVKLRLSSSARKAIRAARPAKATFTVTVTASDAAGNRSSRQVRVAVS